MTTNERATPTFKPKPCHICGDDFTPIAGAQKRCDECQNDPNACRECGWPVSGREKWGDAYGGGCDRAEQVVHNLMQRLGTTTDKGENSV